MLVLTYGRINFGPPNYASTNTWPPKELQKFDCLLFGIVNDIESGREHKTEFFVIRFLKIYNIILIKINQSLWQNDYNKKISTMQPVQPLSASVSKSTGSPDLQKSKDKIWNKVKNFGSPSHSSTDTWSKKLCVYRHLVSQGNGPPELQKLQNKIWNNLKRFKVSPDVSSFLPVSLCNPDIPKTY